MWRTATSNPPAPQTVRVRFARSRRWYSARAPRRQSLARRSEWRSHIGSASRASWPPALSLSPHFASRYFVPAKREG